MGHAGASAARIQVGTISSTARSPLHDLERVPVGIAHRERTTEPSLVAEHGDGRSPFELLERYEQSPSTSRVCQ
jgi:hypothetical protein